MKRIPIFSQCLLAILFVALCSCATFDNPEYEWKKWSDGLLVSMVDDSLAVVKISKYKNKFWYSGFGQENNEIIDSHGGLFLVNYRNKQKPLLGDTLPYSLIIANEYYKDSSALVFDINESRFGFWKIGTKSIEFKSYNNSRSCNLYANPEGDVSFKARPWVNRSILLKPNSISYGCPMSILNPETGQIKPFDFSGENEWLSDCTDMSYIGSKIVCIRKNDLKDYFELVVDGTIADTLAHGISDWYGNYLKDNRYGRTTLGGVIGEISKIDTLNFKFDNSYMPMRVENLFDKGYMYRWYSEFQGSNEFIYKARDLIGGGN